MMRLPALIALLISVAAAGCGEKAVTPTEAKSIADGRYAAHAKALGAPESPVPAPAIQDRGSDTVFVYIEPVTHKRITVIVERSGQIADTVEPL